jgi:beta-lactamase class A
MKAFARAAFCLFFVLSFSLFAVGQVKKETEIVPPRNYQRPDLKSSADLKSLLTSAVSEVINSYPAGTYPDKDIAATLIDLRDPKNLEWADFRGEERIYPASVIKMLYMAALERQLEDGKIADGKELERGLKDMIVDSSNEATQYVLDVLTNTSSGAELPAAEFEKWQYKRNRVNRFFTAMGYSNINANQKTFCEDAYGIEQQTRHYKGENRNMLTTNAVARLLTEIVLGRMNSPARTKIMMDLMHRDPFSSATDPDDQGHGFTGKLFIDRKMTDVKLWSKAGWTNTSRHDSAYIETADGLKFVFVIFTEHHANEKGAIPAIAGKVIDGLRKLKR